MRLFIVSGLSGSGKSVALAMLEDLDYYCIDNIPAALLESFIEQILGSKDPVYERTAVGIDARNLPENLRVLPQTVRNLRDTGVRCELLFLHATDDILVKRYNETRRRHPLSAGGLSLKEAIAREKRLLAPIRDIADLVLDTTRTSIADLRGAIRKRAGERAAGELSLLFESFGYKHGVPSDTDFVFDVRCLPNPFWDSKLRLLTGQDDRVIEFLDAQESVRDMLRDLTAFLDQWIPAFRDADRAYLTIAIGCTGGQHRSVYFANRLSEHFRGRFGPVLVRHNELSGDAEQSAPSGK